LNCFSFNFDDLGPQPAWSRGLNHYAFKNLPASSKHEEKEYVRKRKGMIGLRMFSFRKNKSLRRTQESAPTQDSPEIADEELTPEPSAWSPLLIRVFRSLWIASLVSNIGTWMHNVGGVWLMTSLSDSALIVALMQTATSLPVFLVVLPAGALADIVDRRKFLLCTPGGMLAAAAALAALTLMGLTTSWVLLGLTFALGLGAAMNMPAWQAIMPDLVPREQLSAAIALNGIAFNVARAVGPALGGAIVAAAGPGAVFLLNSLSFLAVIAVIFSWDEPRQEANSAPSEHVFEAVRTGMRYVFNAPALKSALIRCWLFIICAGALWALMPVVARWDLGFGATGFGVLLACMGAGAIVGAVILQKLRRTIPLDSLMIGATVVFACATLALAHIRNLAVLGLMMISGGAAWTTLMSSFNVAVQTCAPSWVRARVLGFYTRIFQCGLAKSGAGSLVAP
jgi:MFS family permease